MSTPMPPRLVSLDAYRGFIMLAMASSGFAFAQVHKNLKLDTPVWNFLAFQFDHVEWQGCAFWDLIQPSFMFMVGVALPFSFASRTAHGDSYANMLGHAVRRAIILVLLGVFLSSAGPPRDYPTTNWIFPNVLAQIGLGYVFVFLLVGRGLLAQLAAVAVILAGYTLYFGMCPAPGPDFDWKAVGVPPGWPHYEGWFAHWDKNSNAAHFFDVWFLNLFPRGEPFAFNSGGYQTLNFVPSMATMILGLIAGELLVGPLSAVKKFTWLAFAALLCLAVGMAMGETVNPIVKRIWTPSWAVYSAGWTFAMLAAFYGVIDVLGWKWWSFPLVVVGMNSIAMYLMSQQLRGWVRKSMHIHLGKAWFAGDYGPVVETTAILFVLWVICLWMYRQRIFLRI
jgi:heparan-alpha-glucosaminide N-acetyltransferase